MLSIEERFPAWFEMVRKLNNSSVLLMLAIAVFMVGGVFLAEYLPKKRAVDRLIRLLPFTARQPSEGAQPPFLTDLVAGLRGFGGEKMAVRRLIKELEDERRLVRSEALRALRALRSHAELAIPAARKALDDPEADVRIEAANFLRQIRAGTYMHLSTYDIERLSGTNVGFAFVPDGTVWVRAVKAGEVVFVRVPADFPRSGSFDEISRIQAHEDNLFAMGLSRNGTKLVTVGTRSTDADDLDASTSELTIHPLSDWVPGSPTVIPIDAGELELAAFSHDSQFLATAGRRVEDGKEVCVLKLWDPAKAQELFSFDRPGISYRSLRFSWDGKTLAALAVEAKMREGEATTPEVPRPKPPTSAVDVVLWDTTTTASVARFAELMPSSWVLALSPDGVLLALGGGMRYEGRGLPRRRPVVGRLHASPAGRISMAQPSRL